MKQTAKLFIATFLVAIFVLPFVAALVPEWFVSGAKLVTGVDITSTAPEVVVRLIVWLILFVTFGDILYGFSPFSKIVCWLIGLGLAILAAVIGWVAALASFLFQIGAVVGVAGVGLSIIVAFVAFFGAVWGLGGIALKLRKFKTQQEAEQAIQGMETGIEGLKRVGKKILK